MDAIDREESERQVISNENSGIERGHLGALILLCAAVAAAPHVTRTFGFSGFAAVYGLATGAWIVARRCRLSLKTTLLLAAGLRLAFLVAPPQLSGDVYRYLWDGRVFAAGVNPYRYAPDDVHLSALRQSWHGQINHPQIRTIYPPHAELLFAAFHTIVGWRLLLLACEILVILRLPLRAAIAYALFPPVIFEGAWSGHIEVVAAILLLAGTSWALAAAAGLKVIPLAAAPALLRRTWREVIVFALILFVPAVPFLMSGPFMPGFHDYATRWVFNSPLYALLFPAMERLAPHMSTAWTAIKDPLRLEPLSSFVYRHIYADFLTRAVMGAIAVVGISARLASNGRRHDDRSAAADCIGMLLLCSPAIHPWYWIVLVPLTLASRPVSGGERIRFETALWLSLSLFAPLSYLLYAKAPPLGVFALCYGLPLAVALIASSLHSQRAASAFSDRDMSR